MDILVVPTIREASIRRFLDEWQGVGTWDAIVVIEDNPTKTFALGDIENLHHYSWAEIENDLGENRWIISRRDSAIRSYGFLIAYRMGAERIHTLDDDCYPREGADACRAHVEQLTNQPLWTTSVPGLRVRGLPYRNFGTRSDVKLNMGLWTNCPDLDGIQALSRPDLGEGWTPPENFARVMPSGYFPLCGMNVAFARELTPLMYFPLMGEGQPFRRFDDIWCGVIMKRVCDHLRYAVSVGPPLVHHDRASDAFANLVREAPGVAAHESFWQTIDEIPLTGSTPCECLRELGRELATHEDEYLARLGRALELWSGLFDGQAAEAAQSENPPAARAA